ncbi:MAG: hypothetical protein MJE12_25520 [Alphaproteobacteria bacterium]|nr:hypothetical protein [Alphaproteobacteria bacterium]
MSQIDVFKTARHLISEFGNQAVVEAAMRSDRMLDMGDLHGMAQWNQVMQAIEDVLSTGA